MDIQSHSIDSIHGVDITFIDKELVFRNGTKEHNALINFTQQEWDEYECLMYKYGRSVAYNHTNDVFVVKVLH